MNPPHFLHSQRKRQVDTIYVVLTFLFYVGLLVGYFRKCCFCTSSYGEPGVFGWIRGFFEVGFIAPFIYFLILVAIGYTVCDTHPAKKQIYFLPRIRRATRPACGTPSACSRWVQHLGCTCCAPSARLSSAFGAPAECRRRACDAPSEHL